MTKPGCCLWCDIRLKTAGQGTPRLFCSDAHRAAYKRVQRATTLADLVEKLGPFVADDGIWIYQELVEHLAGKVNERV